MRFPCVFYVAVSMLLAGCATRERAAPSPDDALVGAWRSRVQFQDGAFGEVRDLEFLYAFQAGGTMTESSNYDGLPPVPPAYGLWRSAGPGRFEATYLFYTTKPPDRVEDLVAGGGWRPAGHGVLRETIVLGSDGQTFESTITMDLYDQAGNAVPGGGRAIGRGERVRF